MIPTGLSYGGVPYYRLGYCPVAFEKGFAKAKTFLTPGYRNTPEYGRLLNNKKIGQTEKNRLIGMTTNLTSLEMLMQEKTDHIKWFHENGIPQVVQMEHEVFRFSDTQKQVRIADFEPLVRRRDELLGQSKTDK